jgi:uncharacterized protein (TIGR02145 family)
MKKITFPIMFFFLLLQACTMEDRTIPDSQYKSYYNVGDSTEYTAGNGNNNNTETYNCINGNCIKDDSNSGTFSSLSACQISCGNTISFTDPRDAQTYETVRIGNQTWFAENLRFSGGIQQVSGNANWVAIWNNGNPTKQPAWCYYNDSVNYDFFGKLYNWYAVNTGTLCPFGWHIPTEAEWKALINYLGGGSEAGGKMKATSSWNQPNLGATNSSGFSALPSGIRYRGRFSNAGAKSFWWSSTEVNQTTAMFFNLNYYDDDAEWTTHDKTVGMTCRCLKD